MFTCDAVENGNDLMYSWFKTDESGITVLEQFHANSSTLLIQNVTVSDSGYYQCRVQGQDRYIANSIPAQLSGNHILCKTVKVLFGYNIVIVTVQIISHPVSVTSYENSTASLICRAEGSGPINYQWAKVNGEIADSRAEGINGPILTIYPVTEQDEGEYYCVVSNEGAHGTTHTDTSQSATISLYGEAKHASLCCCSISYSISIFSTINHYDYRS